MKKNIPVAVITGASRGSGRAIADAMVDEGYFVIPGPTFQLYWVSS